MSEKALIHGLYKDEEKLKEGALLLRSARIRVKEVFFPIPYSRY